MHPLVTDLDKLSDEELQARVNSLTSKYFWTQDPQVQGQIRAYLMTYNMEIETRYQAAWQKIIDTPDKNIDKLININ
jgi:hypothetical protein